MHPTKLIVLGSLGSASDAVLAEPTCNDRTYAMPFAFLALTDNDAVGAHAEGNTGSARKSRFDVSTVDCQVLQVNYAHSSPFRLFAGKKSQQIK